MSVDSEMRVELWLLGRPEHGRSAATLDLSILDEEERHRAGTCRRSAGGALYATAHIALRRLLGDRLCMPAAELFFVREPCPGCGEPHGRPALAAPSADVHFSLSHSNGMVLIGIAGTPIGVDVEPVPRSETVRICTPALHPAEREEVLAVPEGLPRRVAFGRLWTRKESYLKGIGTGLARGLALDYLGDDPARRPPGWTVMDIPCGPHHCAATAIHGRGPVVPTVRRLSEQWLLAAEGSRPYGVRTASPKAA